MFYAASEIVFWILLATLIGGGIGYGINEAKSVRLGKRLNDSGADAPLERELAVAWDTIEDLNRRLQVAHETIRNTMPGAAGAGDESAPLEPTVPLAPPDAVPIPIGAAPSLVPTRPMEEEPEPAGHSDPDAVTFDGNGSEPATDDEAAAPEAKADTAEDDTAEDDTEPVADEAEESAPEATRGVVGARLSERVASASIANRIDETIKFD